MKGNTFTDLNAKNLAFGPYHYRFTEVLHLEDVIPFFCAHPSNLGNYWADCVQIRHGGSFLQYILNYRGDFLIFHP